jgi:iron complex outermembrane receptor protein
MKTPNFCVFALSIAAALSGISQSSAQSSATAAPAPGASSSGDQLADVVVTAQRVSQSLQQVPIAVTAVSGHDAEIRGLDSVESLSTSIPALDVHIQGTAPSIFLRGIGTDQGTPNVEQSVALYVDGVYYPNATANVFTFNNIDRIEVLKGPQGTLFGRNATGGVIQIVTLDPQQTPEVDATLGYGNYQTVESKLYVTGGLSQNVAADFAVDYGSRNKGLGHDITTNTEVGTNNSTAIRTKVLFTPGDKTEIRLTADYEYVRDDLLYQTPQGVVALDGVVGYVGRYNDRSNFPSYNQSEQYGASLRVDQDFDVARLASITSWRQVTAKFLEDEETSPLPIVDATFQQPTRDYTEELQLLSPKGSQLQWVVGAFYFSDWASFDPGQIAGSAAAPLPYLNYYGTQTVKSESIYAQATAQVIADTNLTTGIRYTNDEVGFQGSATTIPTVGAVVPYETESFTSRLPTYRASLDHAFSTDVNTYVSYNRGVKTGGYNMFVPTSQFQPETLNAYELGTKTEWFDRRLRVNVAAYYYDYKNIQVTIVRSGLLESANAAAATMKGADVDVQAKLGSQFDISGGASYLDGRYKSYDNAVYYGNSPYSPIPTLPATGASGNPTIYSPKFTGNLLGNYRIPSAVGEFTLSASAAYTSGSNSDPYGVVKNPTYTLVNTSLNWAATSHLSVRGWVKNVTDREYFIARVPTSVGTLQIPADPRTYGVSVSVKY